MLLNNEDISSYGAKLLTKDIQTAEVITYQEWLKNAPSFIVQGQEEKYKAIACEFAVKGTDDDNILEKISNLVKFAENCTIQFDGSAFLYDATIKNKNHKRLNRTLYTLRIEWQAGYAYQAEITEILNQVASKTINVPGNLKTPAVIEITPTLNLATVTVAGMTVNNLTANQTVIISTQDFTVLQGAANKYGDTAGDFPYLQPGQSTITVSNTNCTVNVKYKPRWL